jgi:hypothetical protein
MDNLIADLARVGHLDIDVRHLRPIAVRILADRPRPDAPNQMLGLPRAVKRINVRVIKKTMRHRKAF